jgi:integrase/recombinase XerD
MGKTGKPRMVPCPYSKAYIAAYMNDYQIPYPPPLDEFIFWIIRRPSKGKPAEKMGLQYQTIAKMIKTAAKDAGIKKKVTPHLFRHSAITQAVRDGLPETVLKKIMWGNKETGMLRTYAHLSNPDIVNAVKARYGMPIEQKKSQDRKNLRDPEM